MPSNKKGFPRPPTQTFSCWKNHLFFLFSPFFNPKSITTCNRIIRSTLMITSVSYFFPSSWMWGMTVRNRRVTGIRSALGRDLYLFGIKKKNTTLLDSIPFLHFFQQVLEKRKRRKKHFLHILCFQYKGSICVM